MPDFVDTILQPMPQEEILEYHASLICHVTEEQGDIEVVPDVGRGKGKGVVACQAIQHGTRILTEAPLVSTTSLKAVYPPQPSSWKLVGTAVNGRVHHQLQQVDEPPHACRSESSTLPTASMH